MEFFEKNRKIFVYLSMVFRLARLPISPLIIKEKDLERIQIIH